MKKNFLDAVDVKSPCSESWDEMFGNDEVRFCSHCAKDVHNLSAMTRQKAEEILKSNKSLCVRYVKTPHGKLITAPPKLTQITRRATIAASVLVTTLSLSTIAYAQGESIKPKDNSAQTQKDKSKNDEIKQGVSTISGEVRDELGAVIPGAKITLHNLKTKKLISLYSKDDGFYEFSNVEVGIYEIQIESNGFKKLVLQNIELLKDVKLEKALVLESNSETVGLLAIVDNLVETDEVKPNDKLIEQRQLVSLPINNQKFTVMGVAGSPTTFEIEGENATPFVRTKKEKPKKKKN